MYRGTYIRGGGGGYKWNKKKGLKHADNKTYFVSLQDQI